jgi:Arc/MetJ-type ribon-helix-helix transcriptional regulator
MIIHLPEDVESSIHAAVLSGHFPSVDDAVATAWRAYQSQRRQGLPVPEQPAVSDGVAAQKLKAIWEVFEDIAASVPDEVWDKIPADSSEQLDHYLYHTPKRPPSP